MTRKPARGAAKTRSSVSRTTTKDKTSGRARAPARSVTPPKGLRVFNPPRSLSTYRAKRDFTQTAEPSGAATSAGAGDGFVIQKHAARRLHYDFRLELDGALLSWAVPRGPSLKAGERRLAVRTEDHPLDYADFEGVIPAGQYGSGAVIVWDRGTWEGEGDPRDGLRRGRLTFTLAGHKLRGRWHLVRTKGVGKAESWLLFKGRDEAADDARDVTADAPDSVISGRPVEAVAAAPERVWRSNRAGGDASGHLVTKPAAPSPKPAAAPATPPAADPAATPASVPELLRALPLGFPLTNLDKVLYPEQALTKASVIAYLAVVAERMLPHVGGRPLTLVRCPDGRGKPCFFQKHLGAGAPPSIGVVDVPGDDGVARYMRVDDLAGLIGLAQLGSLEIHTWACRADRLERPDRLVIDLDPDEGLPWGRVVEAALEVRERLRALDLTGYVTTTGGRGLHVVVPLARRHDWDEHKAFARALAQRVAADAPDRYTASPVKARRKGRLFVDYLRNGRGATFIAPYSMRARADAPVATPIAWVELATVTPDDFTIETVPRRLAQHADPWADLGRERPSITAAMWQALGGRPTR